MIAALTIMALSSFMTQQPDQLFHETSLRYDQTPQPIDLPKDKNDPATGEEVVTNPIVTDQDNNSDEEFLDDFDIDTPLDTISDFGVDWPDDVDQPENETNEPRKSADTEFLESTSSASSSHSNDDSSFKGQDTKIAADDETDTELVTIETDAAFDDSVELEDESEEQDDLIRLDDSNRRNYTILFSGLENIETDRIFNRFNLLSELQLRSKEETNGSQILRRAKTDVILVEQLLRLEGYYDSLVEYRIEDRAAGEKINSPSINVIINAITGPQYRVGDITLSGLETIENTQFFRQAFPFSNGSPLQQDAILEGRENLISRLLENGYIFSTVGEPSLLIDHDRQEGDLTLSVTPDKQYSFGRIITQDDTILSARHLQNIARFEPGQIFKQSHVNDLRQAIFATSLASRVVLTPVQSDTDADVADLEVLLAPAPPRTISGLVGFNTGEGVRIEANWEHRNFFPPEGAINIAGILGTREQAAGVIFRRSNFGGRDRVLTASLAARNQNLDAFDARSLDIGISYERKTTLIFQKKWTWNAGIEYSLSDERAAFGGIVSRELFNIVAFPAGLTYDASDNILDPTKGFRISARISPEISTGVDEIAYFKSQFDASVYQPLGNDLVVAGRVRLGSIAGANTDGIAPSRRNYSGGGGSVRGFGFQDIGPIDINGNPTGGRGLAEFAIEARYRIGNFGIVPFIDAGGVSNSALPDFEDLRYAAGIGLRYYTSFGPVRIDIGAPINRRAGENRIAVAISLGQAF